MSVWDFPMPHRDDTDLSLWVAAVRLRTAAVFHDNDADWLRAAIASLDGPSVYEQLCVERSYVPPEVDIDKAEEALDALARGEATVLSNRPGSSRDD